MRNLIQRAGSYISDIPRSILQAAVYLTSRLVFLCVVVFMGTLLHRRAMSPVIRQYSKTPPRGPRDYVVTRLKVQEAGSTRPLMVRFYKTGASWLLGLRYLFVKAIIRRNGIGASATIGYGQLRLGGRPYFTIVDEYISGYHPQEWTEQLAFQLGRNLARWHRVRICWPIASVIGIILWNPEKYRSRAEGRLFRLKAPYKALQAEVYRTIQLLDNEEFCGPYALSHGDLHNRNILVSSNGGLIWLDFDAACCRPVRHDLAEVEIRILRRFPEVIDAFERGYFDTHPAEEAEWRKYRLGWYRIWCSQRALLDLTHPYKLPNFMWASELLALSSTCLEVDDIGQPSTELVSTIVRLTQCKLYP